MLLAAATPTFGQVIGTFAWQTQPYCNVITVTVNQMGSLYQLTGSDNLCGSGAAPVTGTAVPAGGGVAFGMTVALPTGQAAHLSAAINLATLSGTWTDGDGNSGPFAFGAGITGPARPTPAAATAITVSQFSPTIYSGTGSATTVARGDHNHDDRYYTESEIDSKLGTAISIPAAAFTPRFPASTVYEIGSGAQLFATGGTSDAFVAPVQLPNGAIIQSIRAAVWDNSTSSLSVELVRNDMLNPAFSTLFSVASVGASPSTVILVDSTSSVPSPVNNLTHAYFVYVTCPGSWATEMSNLRFQGITITYTLP